MRTVSGNLCIQSQRFNTWLSSQLSVTIKDLLACGAITLTLNKKRIVDEEFDKTKYTYIYIAFCIHLI